MLGTTGMRATSTVLALLVSTALLGACGGSGGSANTGGGAAAAGCAKGTAAKGNQLSVAAAPDGSVATTDGKCWTGIAPTTVTVADVGSGTPSGDSTWFKLAWSSKNLYILTYTTEWPLSNAGGTNWWQSDTTEFDVSGTDDHAGAFTTGNQYQFGVVEDGTLQPGQNAPNASPQPTPLVKIVPNKGFYTELVVPWATLQVSKPAKGQKYQFDLGQDYGDSSGARVAQIVWQADPSMASSSDWHADTSQWGDITLS